MQAPSFTYLMASQRNGTPSIGSTTKLIARSYQQHHGVIEGFSKEHGCKHLVWYEVHDELEQARLRELRIKKWKRPWKLQLIEAADPHWRDLAQDLAG